MEKKQYRTWEQRGWYWSRVKKKASFISSGLMKTETDRSEETELFLSETFLLSLGLNLDNVEPDGLWQRSALADGHDISIRDSGECWRAVSGQVFVSLLESAVLLDVMKVVSSDYNCSLHLGRNNDTPIYIIIINITFIYLIQQRSWITTKVVNSCVGDLTIVIGNINPTP